MPELNVKRIRKDFPILSTKMNGKPLVYLDNAATSQKPKQVINAISYYYRHYNANIHRGVYKIAGEATEAYTNSKSLAASFINANSYRNIVYLRNTTEAINLIARAWGDENIRKGEHILTTQMEHHSNIVPWQMLAKRKGAVVDYTKLKDAKTIDMEDFKEKLELGPKLATFTHVSNVLGTINDAKEMVRLAHKAGAVTLVDAAQSVPHMRVDAKEINCDFMAFSSHKMLGPNGIGVLYGKEELLDAMPPFYGGGDMIRSVSFREATWNDLPWKFEAGTQNIEGGIGFGAAIEYLNKIGIDRVREHEIRLTKHALSLLEDERDVEVYGLGKKDVSKKGGVISFNIKGAHAHDVATVFDSEGIAIRSGHHCAMPLVTEILGTQAVSRMSFYLYNTEEEIEKAMSAIKKVRQVLHIKV
jgi:cysteine desulfurase/selenocysteine lyase